jgi:hypothetical protein
MKYTFPCCVPYGLYCTINFIIKLHLLHIICFNQVLKNFTHQLSVWLQVKDFNEQRFNIFWINIQVHSDMVIIQSM